MPSFKQRKSGIIQPENTILKKNRKLSTNITEYIQKKVFLIDNKNVCLQLDPPSDTKTNDTTESLPPTPPPKKSYTAPNLSIITDRDALMHRALPSLPSIASFLSQNDGKTSISRAKTWVGKSLQKWLTNTQSEQQQKTFDDLPELQQDSEVVSLNQCISNASTKKMTLHCRILQVTNLTSAKSYQYTMHMNVTGNSIQTHSGIMKRVAKGLSAAHPRAALSFEVEGQFHLDCDLIVKPDSSNSFVNRLKSFRSKTDLNKLQELQPSDGSIVGKISLDSGDDPLSSFANKGIGRYSIKTSDSVTLELTIAFWLEEISDETEKEDQPTPIDQDILRFCQAGDYLTFYVKGETHPSWNRYWVTYQSSSLILRVNERGGDPIDIIPIEEINCIDTNPSEDIREEVYLGKKHAVVLSFGKSNVYMFCDNFKSLRYWKCLFEQHMNSQDKTVYDKKIHLKYLWPSVAQ